MREPDANINLPPQDSLLTRIHNTYTLSDTEPTHNSEIERTMIDNFLKTLAEISLAIASRQVKENNSCEVNR
jgi:hypothetical protein